MENNKLHIIASSVPWPPDYGGGIDVFYKLKALQELGVKIILHCYEYNRPEANELKNFCEKVYYYPRKTGLLNQFSLIPYIVKSRYSQLLLARLMEDNHPILFEGMHTIAYLGHPALKDRKRWVRAHNVEHDYYNSLVNAEKHLYKKIYYKLEACKLKRYNSHLALADGVFAISQPDATGLKKIHQNTLLIPAFHGYTQVGSLTGKGDYILYHGDLSIAENNRSAEFMIEVCKDLHYDFYLAGKEPHKKLKKMIKPYPNIQLKSNPDTDMMKKLIKNAGVILLPAKQTTGLRLKLLISLFIGRHCIASPEMVIETGLEKLCNIAESKDEWQQTIKMCMNTPFTMHHIEQRRNPLKYYLDVNSAKEIVRLIFG